ncbi:MAG TPA: SGNH/GDSL hydrolase family protein [Pseudobacter sp.]|nr:SGNH/GDSL hydrolase family protein [Pseudobacter sp.]
MKKFLTAFTLLIILASFTTFQKPERIIFFGDSITQAGVNPKGYISVLRDLVKSKGLENKYELIGAGIGGNKVYDLYLRLEDDVLSKDPSTVVIWVGVNDVWHKRSSGTGTDADKFEKFYNALIKKLKEKNIKVLLCTPAAIGEKTDFSNELDGDLNKYAAIIRQIATNNNCELIDLRKAFLDYNLVNNKKNEEKGILTTDRVHLNDAGNKLVAEEMYKHLIK